MTHLDLFSGIGGFALAAETVWPEIEHTFCEIDPFCRVVIKKHWPNAHIYGDIRTLTNTRSEESCGIPGGERETIPTLGTCDLLTGGFPCQPFSHAGKRKGTDDDRHLWPEMRRVIQEFSPRYVVAENVRGLLSIEGGMVFETVCTDLEALGYEVQPVILPACAVNAPHRRDRVWIVARNTKYDGCNGSQDQKSSATRSDGNTAWTKEIRKSARPALPRDDAADSSDGRGTRFNKRQGEIQSGRDSWREDWPTVATRLCRVDDGLPDGVARPKGWRNAALKAYGNAIVPQVAIQIFQAIKQTEQIHLKEQGIV